MLKKIMSLLIVLAMVLSFAGCGEKTDTTDTKVEKTDITDTKVEKTDTTEPVKEVEVKTLVLTAHASWVNAGAEALIEYVNSKSAETGAVIELDLLPEGEQGFSTLQTRMAVHEYPDILATHSAKIAVNDLGGAAIYADIAGDWMSNYDQDILNSKQFSAGGKTIAAPFGPINVGGMLYNKQVFADLGLEIPETWDEFLAICEAVKSAGKVPVYYSGADTWTLQLIPILGFGREMVGVDAEALFEKVNTNKMKFSDFDKFEDSIAKYLQLQELGYTNTNTVFSDTYDNAQKALIEGDAAMYSMASWVIPGMVEAYGQEAVNNIGAFAVPFDGNDPVAAWMPWVMLVPEGENKELATKIVQLMASKEGQQVFYTAEPAIPLAKGIKVELSPAVQELYDIFSAEGRGKPEYASLTTYNFGPFDRSLAEVLTGTMTPADVLAFMDESYAADAQTKDDPNWD